VLEYYLGVDTPFNLYLLLLQSDEVSRRISEGGSSQKLMLFIRGNAISGAPIRIGTRKLPKPPIRIGLTIKKIIRKACAVITTLYS